MNLWRPSQAHAAQAQRVHDHRNRAERHRRTCDDRVTRRAAGRAPRSRAPVAHTSSIANAPVSGVTALWQQLQWQARCHSTLEWVSAGRVTVRRGVYVESLGHAGAFREPGASVTGRSLCGIRTMRGTGGKKPLNDIRPLLRRGATSANARARSAGRLSPRQRQPG